ncbi:aspartyl-phosphate phosphatase Spo0E family protein [Tumebacillus permanentifrigoris]|uniref:Spo0E like sporulation regulatory protein n=1 Tax=Tumebacillus permanentifrigoris TaxID=378543 RepID=A0A316DF56_9BACL|nr:aspartyl-phosphate phosphatase Spo0E family protein [Tumebacillus permanentifrigoris]PWK16218.1 Spo0E like sporulation regulatory protein [Tumebacillus permanentifrigoris]
MDSYLEEIERIRRKLNEVVKEYKGDLLHPTVLQVSQQLDRYIVNFHSKQLQ